MDAGVCARSQTSRRSGGGWTVDLDDPLYHVHLFRQRHRFVQEGVEERQGLAQRGGTSQTRAQEQLTPQQVEEPPPGTGRTATQYLLREGAKAAGDGAFWVSVHTATGPEAGPESLRGRQVERRCKGPESAPPQAASGAFGCPTDTDRPCTQAGAHPGRVGSGSEELLQRVVSQGGPVLRGFAAFPQLAMQLPQR